jgi:hypothetical protein
MADAVERGKKRGKLWGRDEEPEYVLIDLNHRQTLKRVSKPKLQQIADQRRRDRFAVVLSHSDVHRGRGKQRRARGNRRTYQSAEVLQGELEEGVSGRGERRREGERVDSKRAWRPRRQEALGRRMPRGGAADRDGRVRSPRTAGSAVEEEERRGWRGLVAKPRAGGVATGRRRSSRRGASRVARGRALHQYNISKVQTI